MTAAAHLRYFFPLLQDKIVDLNVRFEPVQTTKLIVPTFEGVPVLECLPFPTSIPARDIISLGLHNVLKDSKSRNDLEKICLTENFHVLFHDILWYLYYSLFGVKCALSRVDTHESVYGPRQRLLSTAAAPTNFTIDEFMNLIQSTGVVISRHIVEPLALEFSGKVGGLFTTTNVLRFLSTARISSLSVDIVKKEITILRTRIAERFFVTTKMHTHKPNSIRRRDFVIPRLIHILAYSANHALSQTLLEIPNASHLSQNVESSLFGLLAGVPTLDLKAITGTANNYVLSLTPSTTLSASPSNERFSKNDGNESDAGECPWLWGAFPRPTGANDDLYQSLIAIRREGEKKFHDYITDLNHQHVGDTSDQRPQQSEMLNGEEDDPHNNRTKPTPRVYPRWYERGTHNLPQYYHRDINTARSIEIHAFTPVLRHSLKKDGLIPRAPSTARLTLTTLPEYGETKTPRPPPAATSESNPKRDAKSKSGNNSGQSRNASEKRKPNKEEHEQAGVLTKVYEEIVSVYNETLKLQRDSDYSDRPDLLVARLENVLKSIDLVMTNYAKSKFLNAEQRLHLCDISRNIAKTNFRLRRSHRFLTTRGQNLTL